MGVEHIGPPVLRDGDNPVGQRRYIELAQGAVAFTAAEEPCLGAYQHAPLVSTVASLPDMAAAITLADIVEAVEGPIALATCLDGDDCAAHHDCRVRPHWPLVNETLRGALAAIPLTRLAQEAEPKVPA